MATRILVSIEGVFPDREAAAAAIVAAAQRVRNGECRAQQEVGDNPWVTITEYGDDE